MSVYFSLRQSTFAKRSIHIKQQQPLGIGNLFLIEDLNEEDNQILEPNSYAIITGQRCTRGGSVRIYPPSKFQNFFFYKLFNFSNEDFNNEIIKSEEPRSNVKYTLQLIRVTSILEDHFSICERPFVNPEENISLINMTRLS